MCVCVCVFPVVISRQQRRVQLMRIRQKEERREGGRKKKKKPTNHSAPHTHPPKAMHPEPAYRRKPQPIRRYDGDVLSPVSMTRTHTDIFE